MIISERMYTCRVDHDLYRDLSCALDLDGDHLNQEEGTIPVQMHLLWLFAKT